MSLFFPPIMLLGNSQEIEESAHYAWFLSQQNVLFAVTMAKMFTVGDGEQLVQVLLYMLLGFDNLQFVSTAPWLLWIPQGGLAIILRIERSQKA